MPPAQPPAVPILPQGPTARPDSQAARRSILGALRAGAPAAPLPAPDLAAYRSGPYGQGSQGPRPDPAALADRFEAAARGWRAEVLRASPASWPEAVRQALDQRGCRRVVVGATNALAARLDPALQGLALQRFDRPIEQWKIELFDHIDAGITSTEAGIADTGTLVLRPGPQEPRTLSLVPPLHVAVLMASRLYASLAAAMRALSPEADMPTNLLLVTGPSKTADIQQVLAYGAHGPKALVIVLVDDLAEGGATS
jgi:L-lactate dehydrogenase complex protein LldG